MTAKQEMPKEYPEREIFRHGRYVQCQILKVTNDFWVCHDLSRGDTFIAKPRMGHVCEVDLHGSQVTGALKAASDLEAYKRVCGLIAEALKTCGTCSRGTVLYYDHQKVTKALSEFAKLTGAV